MHYDNDFVVSKLRRWEKHISAFSLPAWEDIPDFGLYMDQIITLMTQYLDYLPPDVKDKQLITSASVNNYVRMKIMPEPVGKKYYREHIAYLIIICILKQSLNISYIQKLVPYGITKEELRSVYTSFAIKHKVTSSFFIEQVRAAAAPILNNDLSQENSVEDLISSCAVAAGLSQLLAEKLLLLQPEESAEDQETPQSN